MLTTSQLISAVDSLDIKIEKARDKLDKSTNRYFWIFKDNVSKDYFYKGGSNTENLKDSSFQNAVKINLDTTNLQKETAEDATNPARSHKKDSTLSDIKIKIDKTINPIGAQNNPGNARHIRSKTKAHKKPLVQNITKPLAEYESISELFDPKDWKKGLYSKAQSYSRNLQGIAMSSSREFNKFRESRVKHIYEMNFKFSMAVICFIFLFIGAPMGAIVRKGGFGYPILIAIIFFMIFIILNVFCKKLAETYVISPQLGSWLPCMVLFPVGILLTFRAMNDSKLINTEYYQRIFTKLVLFFKPNS